MFLENYNRYFILPGTSELIYIVELGIELYSCLI